MGTSKAIRSIGILVLAVAALAAVSFGSLAACRYFGPKWESARTDVYRTNKSYVEGTIRDLRDLKRQWATARDETAREAVAKLALHRAGELDWSNLPRDLQDFLREID